MLVTLPRACARSCLAMLCRQERPVPILVWWEQSATLGETRHRAMCEAIRAWHLRDTDWIAVIDDDDFYTAAHFGELAAAAERRPTAGIVAPSAYVLIRTTGPLELVHVAHGSGPHGATAIRVGAYLRAGGYPPRTPGEDTPLLLAAAADGGIVRAARSTYAYRTDLAHHTWRGLQGSSVTIDPADLRPSLEASDGRRLAAIERFLAGQCPHP